MTLKTITILTIVYSLVCSTPSTFAQKDSARLMDAYFSSISATSIPQKTKIYHNLVSIDPQNKTLIRKTINGEEYILMVSWKSNASYYKNDSATGKYNTSKYNIWVTAAPELKNKFQMNGMKDTTLRLKQLLGLPPFSTYNYFVEFWVKPSDLFRPSADNEINDNTSGLCFPNISDTAHINWVNENRISRFYNCNPSNNYPWTQLGYTYDWNKKNKSHIGLSEFVIKTNKNIIVNGIYTTAEYLKKTK